MEPERKIEKLLQAYAKKRRAQAAEPFALNPGTRQRLHAELARKSSPEANAEAEADSLSLWQLFRQQWAFLVTFALAIFLVSTLILPTLSSAKHKAQRVSSMSNLREIGDAIQMAANDNRGKLPATLDALTNGFLPARVLSDPQSGQPFIYIAGGQNLDELGSNTVLAYSPSNQNGGAVLFADGRVEYMNRDRLLALTTPETMEPVVARDTASLQESPAALSAPSIQFAVGEPFTNLYVVAQSSVVLAKFQLQLSNETVVIHDLDGSTYTGSLIASANAESTKNASEHQNLQSNGIYAFQVAGTNLTLNQGVVFTGTLISRTNNLLAADYFDHGPTTPHPAKTGHQTSGPRILQITGTAIIGGTNRIEINAK